MEENKSLEENKAVQEGEKGRYYNSLTLFSRASKDLRTTLSQIIGLAEIAQLELQIYDDRKKKDLPDQNIHAPNGLSV